MHFETPYRWFEHMMYYNTAELEVFTAMKMQVALLWVVTVI
jgi:hypothetical protein